MRDSYFRGDRVCGSEICAGVCICAHIQRPEEDAGVLLCHMSPSATETESLTEPGASLATNKLLLLLRSNSPSQSPPHSTGVSHLWLCRAHACTINTLTFKSSLLSWRFQVGGPGPSEPTSYLAPAVWRRESPTDCLFLTPPALFPMLWLFNSSVYIVNIY